MKMRMAIALMLALGLVGCAAKIGLNNDFKIPILSGMVLQVNIGKDSK